MEFRFRCVHLDDPSHKAEQQVLRRTALLALVDEVEIAEDAEDDERDRPDHLIEVGRSLKLILPRRFEDAVERVGDDRRRGGDRDELIEQIGRFCVVSLQPGHALALREGEGLYQRWRSSITGDPGLDLMLAAPDLRKTFSELPEHPDGSRWVYWAEEISIEDATVAASL